MVDRRDLGAAMNVLTAAQVGGVHWLSPVKDPGLAGATQRALANMGRPVVDLVHWDVEGALRAAPQDAVVLFPSYEGVPAQTLDRLEEAVSNVHAVVIFDAA